jgi:hypothetical protein
MTKGESPITGHPSWTSRLILKMNSVSLQIEYNLVKRGLLKGGQWLTPYTKIEFYYVYRRIAFIFSMM